MSDQQRTQQILAQQKQRWDTLQGRLSVVQNQYDTETRSDEKLRLNSVLMGIKQELAELEAYITDLEQQLKQQTGNQQLQTLRGELANLRRTKAYQPALDVARQILILLPNDPQMLAEVAELQERLEQGKQAQKVFAQLTAHFAELAPVITELAQVLNPRNEHDHILTMTTLAQHYLEGGIQTADFITCCQNLFQPPAGQASNTSTHQYARVADSIRKGRTVLFLGSDIPHLYSEHSENEQTLANSLAADINYQNFSGSLSAIAEYYQLTPGYGRRSLMGSLQQSLPQAMPNPGLYASLARTRVPLLIISSAYDNLLEQAFQAEEKPYVEVASIIVPSEDYKLGSVVLKYSDRAGETVCSQEDLSRLDLFAQYSVIYKIRGSCSAQHTHGQAAWRDSVTLSESNYFTFAEHASKIIPDYLTRQFRDRGFLFIGFTPAHWEERLLASALLQKRRSHPEPCYTLGKTSDPLQAAFWENQKVRQYEMEFSQLDQHLQEATQ